MKKINAICEEILKLEEKDYKDAEQIINGQKKYISPLRPKTQAWQNELGEYNKKVVKKIKELHELLKTGAEISRP